MGLSWPLMCPGTATTLNPLPCVGTVSLYVTNQQCSAVSEFGLFVDWGREEEGRAG
jgi:hypothetical protein